MSRLPALALGFVVLGFTPPASHAADVLGYSVLKGQFYNQTGQQDLALDPDFGFSLLASVDLTDFQLVTEASLQPPQAGAESMDDLGDSWVFLDSFTDWSSLNSTYGWGDYQIRFTTEHDGLFSCVLSMPDSPLPPVPQLVNFDALQAVNAARPLPLSWSFPTAPSPDDFMQVYITEGHAVVFSSPDFGFPGALDGTSREFTVPADTLWGGGVYSLNLELTRLVSTNASAYPDAEGVAGTFSSTSLDLLTVQPPELRLLSRPTNGIVSVEVRVAPGVAVTLQGSDTVATWNDLATNASPSGTNVFEIPSGQEAARFFRAWQP
jgi:hypothetical protein